MSGKAIFLVVMGFSLLFMVAGQIFNTTSGRMTDNYLDYYNKTNSHNIAVSGANFAANKIFLDPTWTTGYDNLDYQKGKLYVSVEIVNAYKNIRRITSIGVYNHDTSRVKVTIAPSKFSKFAYYSELEKAPGGSNIWWMNRDTVWGPFHTQDVFNTSKHPTFWGKATSKGKLNYETNEKTDKPNFHSGYEKGVDLPMPENGVADIKSNINEDGGGLLFDGTQTKTVRRVDTGINQSFTLNDMRMTFKEDSLTYKYFLYSYTTGSGYSLKTNYVYTDPVTVYLPDASPNGIIYMDKGNIRMQGVVSGAYTVASAGITDKKGKLTFGTVYLDDDIVYKNNPKNDSNSKDMLGIVAENSVWVTENAANNNNINIHASIYTEKGSFGAENYDTRPKSGSIYLLGGIIQHLRAAVSTFNGTTISTGFAKAYTYDERFMIASPPYFPGTGGYEIVSWYE